MRSLWVIAAFVLLAGCSSSAKHPAAKSLGPKMIAVHGSISLSDPDGWESGGDISAGAECSGSGGYDDITAGAQVVVSDDAGKTLKIVGLRAGHLDKGYGCRFPFTASVPAGKGFYGVTVSHRGTVKEPEADLHSVALTLG